MNAPAAELFRAGGTLHRADPSYIPRAADGELLARLRAGQFCYVLTSRQMGKSSLMVRTAERLRQEDVASAIVDLSGLGTQLSRDQWYGGVVKRVATELRLAADAERWWGAQATASPVQRFVDFLHDVVLAEIVGRVVIFIDEIDSTLRLPFTDDFFAAVRLTYNLRASEPDFERLTFVLLGVAAPGDLIKDRNRTPFNIGHAIDLHEFARADASPLERNLDALFPGQGAAILDRIFFWTGGHPYLTQKLCRAVGERRAGGASDAEVDRVVEALFFSEEGLKEDNLQFVRSNIEASPERRRLLHVYRQVLAGARVPENEQSPSQSRLRLIGLVAAAGGQLHVRNPIYRRVFDTAWVRANTPREWARIVTIGAAAVSVAAIVAALLISQAQRAATIARLQEQFGQLDNATRQVGVLAQLCDQDEVRARSFFFALPPAQQQMMFYKAESRQFPDRLRRVAGCLVRPENAAVWRVPARAPVLRELCGALARLPEGDGVRLDDEVVRACEPEGSAP